jgi:carbon monoxide dehydrogenase subunit G
MRLDHEFTVPVPAAQAWPVLLDIGRIAPCMPGATITKVEGDDFEGTVKVKVGPITVTYGGTASFLEKDEAKRIAVIEARGKETRGSGTANARITAQLFDDDAASTKVAVTTDLSITGKPAQFGRGVMNDVGNKLLGRFADCLAGEIAGTSTAATPAPSAAGAQPASTGSGGSAQSQVETAGSGAPASAKVDAGAGNPDSAAATESRSAPASVLDAPPREAEAIDLVEAIGGAVAKRVIPVLAALALAAVVFEVLRRRR